MPDAFNSARIAYDITIIATDQNVALDRIAAPRYARGVKSSTTLIQRMAYPEARPEAIAEIFALYESCKSLPKTAAALDGISERALYRWLDRYPELGEALARAGYERNLTRPSQREETIADVSAKLRRVRPGRRKVSELASALGVTGPAVRWWQKNIPEVAGLIEARLTGTTSGAKV